MVRTSYTRLTPPRTPSRAPSLVARELCRHRRRKGGWSKLVSPSAAHLHARELLDPVDQVPIQDMPIPSFVSEEAARFLPFESIWSAQCPTRVHIDVGELQASPKVLEVVPRSQSAVRIPTIIDY